MDVEIDDRHAVGRAGSEKLRRCHRDMVGQAEPHRPIASRMVPWRTRKAESRLDLASRDSLCGPQHATGGETRGTPRARAYKSVRIQRHPSGLRSSIGPGEPGKEWGSMDPPQRLLRRFHRIDRNDSL